MKRTFFGILIGLLVAFAIALAWNASAETETVTMTATEVPTENATITATEVPTQTVTITATEVLTENATITATEVPTENATITATEVPTQSITIDETEVPTILKQGCAGTECVLLDFDPDRTGIGETNSFPVYVGSPQEVWSAGIDAHSGTWKIWFALPGCEAVIILNTAEHNTITVNTTATDEEIGEARAVWVGQLLAAPNSPYNGTTPILYCTDNTGYK